MLRIKIPGVSVIVFSRLCAMAKCNPWADKARTHTILKRIGFLRMVVACFNLGRGAQAEGNYHSAGSAIRQERRSSQRCSLGMQATIFTLRRLDGAFYFGTK